MSRSGCWLFIAVLSGCAVGPNYRPPDVALSPMWRNAPAGLVAEAPWWLAFNDETLNTLEAEAMAQNLDLEAAAARVVQARGGLGNADAALLPSAGINGSVARVQQSLNAGLGQLSRYVPEFPRTINNTELDLSASWELDFAGGLRRGREAAVANLSASEANYQTARIAIAADVADAYLALVGAQAQLKAAQRYANTLGQQRDIMAVRAGHNAASQQDLSRASALAEDAAGQVPPIRALVGAQHNRIAVLLGRDPSLAFPALDMLQDIPVAPDPAAGHPADILRRRPDVRASEQQLIAANAQIGAALAQYYPTISLSALLAQSTNRLAEFGSSTSSQTQGAAALRWRLFDFVRIDAEIRAARGREREARVAYRQTILLAAESVETAFVQLNSSQERLGHIEREREALVAAAKSAEQAARSGEISREEYLTAERAVDLIELNQARAKADVGRAVVACERSLGAGVAAPDLADGNSARVPPIVSAEVPDGT